VANLKRTPLYERHVALGAKMVPFAGWEMPVSYPAGIIAEHLAARSSAGLFDIGHMGLIQLTTNNLQLTTLDELSQFVQSVTTNDAAKLKVNQCQYSILCNEVGGVVDDILVYRLPECFMIIANAANTDKVVAWLKKLGGNVKIGLYENYAMLSIQGPGAEAMAVKVLNAPLSKLKHNHALWQKDMIISRTGYTGEDGLEIIVNKNEIGPLWDKFINEGVRPCGLGARDTLRLEAGFPLYGHEYDLETSPLEAGYSWAVKFDKGDFIGRDSLLKAKEAGPKKRLVGLELEGRAIPRQGGPVFSALSSQLCGQITSGTFSPTFQKPIALAYLNSSEKTVLVEIRGQRVSAHVVDKAFYKRVK
jgi:aminomethyltransferase